MLMNLKFLSSPPLEPDKKIPFSETAEMFMKFKLEIEPSDESECRGQVVT